MSERRFEDLEVKVAFLEHHLAELDVVLRAQADRLGVLQAELVAIRDERQWAATRGGLAEEVPPHHEPR
jgi:uncharacterized coiled-coil protein SlyX